MDIYQRRFSLQKKTNTLSKAFKLQRVKLGFFHLFITQVLLTGKKATQFFITGLTIFIKKALQCLSNYIISYITTQRKIAHRMPSNEWPSSPLKNLSIINYIFNTSFINSTVISIAEKT